jgi:hypothetical protein
MKSLIELTYIKIPYDVIYALQGEKWFNDVSVKFFNNKKNKIEEININHQLTLIKIITNYNCNTRHLSNLSTYAVKNQYTVLAINLSNKETLYSYGSILMNLYAYMNSQEMLLKVLNVHNIITNYRLIRTYGYSICNYLGQFNSQLYEYYETQLVIDLYFGIEWAITSDSVETFDILARYLIAICNYHETLKNLAFKIIYYNSRKILKHFIKTYGYFSLKYIIQIGTHLNDYQFIDFVINL